MTITGADLRMARKAAKLALAQVAGRMGRSTGYLSRVETGGARVTPAIVVAYEEATGTKFAGADAKFAATREAGDGLTVDDMRRRNFLGVVAAASVGGAAVEPLAHLLDGLPPPLMPRFVGASETAAVEQAVDLYTSLDLQYGGGLAGEIARGSLAWATRLFNQEMTDTTRQRLRAAVAALADRVAWSNYDMGNYEIAGRLFTLALNTAARSDDRDLRAHILLNLSTQTYDLGNGPDAVEMLHLALGDDRVSPVERANLHSVCARHCGGIGDRQSALRQIGMAETALGEVDDTEPARWARRVTAEPGHADSALGLALFATGEDQSAIDRFTAALAGLGPGRVRTALRCRTRLAVLYMRDGSFDAGEAEARHAMAAAGQVRSKRVDDDMNMMVTAAETYGLHQLALDLRGGLPS